MGDLDEQQTDKLDEQIWGSDDEDDKDEAKVWLDVWACSNLI